MTLPTFRWMMLNAWIIIIGSRFWNKYEYPVYIWHNDKWSIFAKAFLCFCCCVVDIVYKYLRVYPQNWCTCQWRLVGLETPLPSNFSNVSLERNLVVNKPLCNCCACSYRKWNFCATKRDTSIAGAKVKKRQKAEPVLYAVEMSTRLVILHATCTEKLLRLALNFA